jgi:hypothetical protein
MAYPGHLFPVRLRVQDPNGKQIGYLQFAVNPNSQKDEILVRSDPARTVWYLDIYTPPHRIENTPRALMNGDRAAIYGWSNPTSCYVVELHRDLNGQDDLVVPTKKPGYQPGQYIFRIVDQRRS